MQSSSIIYRENEMNDVGYWMTQKYRRLQIMCGTKHAAYLLRKQGVPLSIALQILARR